MNDDELIGFIGFERDRRDGRDLFVRFDLFTDRTELESWRAGNPSDVVRDPPADDTKIPAKDTESKPSSNIKEILDRFLKAMSSANSTISFSRALSPLFRYLFINTKLAPHVFSNLPKIIDEEKRIAFSYNLDQFRELVRIIEELVELNEGHDRLPDSILLGIVALFDSYFAEIVKLFISIHPERYTASDKQISMKDIFSRKNLQDVIDHVIDEEIADVMRGSHTDQVKFVETNLNVKIIDHYERWPNFVEIFERRNLAAHGNLNVNSIYLDKIAMAKFKSPPPLGKKLELSSKYLHNCVNILTEFNLLLGFTLWRKHIETSDEEAFSYMSKICYNLILKNRPRLARRLLEFLLHKQKRGCSDATHKIMIINYANTNKILKDIGACKKALSSVDWSASNDNYKLCIASLEDDVEKVLTLLPNVFASKSISAHEFREWPVLQWIRPDKRVAQLFEELYKEPLQPAVLDSLTKAGKTNATSVAILFDSDEPKE